MKEGILFFLSLWPSLRQMHLTKIDCFVWNEKWLSFRSPVYLLVITSETVFWLLLRPALCFLFDIVTELIAPKDYVKMQDIFLTWKNVN